MFASGERLPMLLDRDGQPMFGPTVFTLTELRGRNRAANTIGIALRSLMAFHLFLDARSIDLDARLRYLVADGRLGVDAAYIELRRDH